MKPDNQPNRLQDGSEVVSERTSIVELAARAAFGLPKVADPTIPTETYFQSGYVPEQPNVATGAAPQTEQPLSTVTDINEFRARKEATDGNIAANQIRSSLDDIYDAMQYEPLDSEKAVGF